MTYTIKFVNFTLEGLFQNNLGRWWGLLALPALYGRYAHEYGQINELHHLYSKWLGQFWWNLAQL